MDDLMNVVGEAAGEIWRALDGKSEGISLTQLKNRTELPDNLLHQGLGWLAREDKILLSRSGKKTTVRLTLG